MLEKKEALFRIFFSKTYIELATVLRWLKKYVNLNQIETSDIICEII